MPKRSPVVFQVDWSGCIRCGACVAACPQKAGFTTAFDTIAVDTPCDIACMACEKICPVSAITSRAAALNGPVSHAPSQPKPQRHVRDD